MGIAQPIQWVDNHHAATVNSSAAVDQLFPDGIFWLARDFHRQIPGYPDYFRRVVWEGVEAVPEAYRWSPS